MQAGGQGFDPPRLHRRNWLVCSCFRGRLATVIREAQGGELRGNISPGTALADGLLGVDARLVLELVDDVPAARQSEARVVPES